MRHPAFLYGLALGLVMKDALMYAADRYGDRLNRLRTITTT